MADLTVNDCDNVYQTVREILLKARHQAMQTVNAEMVRAYWEIGRTIVEQEQQGQARAEYGMRLIENLSSRLTEEFGRGFTDVNVKGMRRFYMLFPIRHSVSAELSWSHYRRLLKVEKPCLLYTSDAADE